MANKKKQRRLAPVSLHPLEPEEALAGLLQVKPELKETPADEQREQEAESKTTTGVDNET